MAWLVFNARRHIHSIRARCINGLDQIMSVQPARDHPGFFERTAFQQGPVNRPAGGFIADAAVEQQTVGYRFASSLTASRSFSPPAAMRKTFIIFQSGQLTRMNYTVQIGVAGG